MKRITLVVLLLMLAIMPIRGQQPPVAPPPPMDPNLKALIELIKQLNDGAQKLLNPTPPPVVTPPVVTPPVVTPPVVVPPVVPPTTTTTGTDVQVPAGADLQAAINAAQPGQTLWLASKQTYTGNFTLPKKTFTVGSNKITIRTAGMTDSVLPPTTRVTPLSGVNMAKLAVKDPLKPTLETDDGAHDWVLIGLEVLGNETYPDRDTMVIGALDMTSLDQVPVNITLDRMYIHGGSKGGHRGVAFNTKNGKIIHSDIRGYWEVGRDSQAIHTASGPGPFLIEDNYIEGSGENYMTGGSDPKIPDLVPSDIVFRGNHVFKPLDWKLKRGSVKNLFELKNARRVLIENNVFENNWVDAQSGSAIVFTVRNQGTRCPWCVVEDVTFQNNVVKNVGVGGFSINMHGFDDLNPGLTPSRKFKIINNAFLNTTRGIQILNAPSDVVIQHNTFVGITYVFLTMSGSKFGVISGLVVTDNVMAGGSYGISGEGTTVGLPSLDAMTTGSPYKFSNNVIQKSTRIVTYPTGNWLLAPDTLAAHLNPDWSYKPDAGQVSTDGKPLGADIALLKTKLPAHAFVVTP